MRHRLERGVSAHEGRPAGFRLGAVRAGPSAAFTARRIGRTSAGPICPPSAARLSHADRGFPTGIAHRRPTSCEDSLWVIPCRRRGIRRGGRFNLSVCYRTYMDEDMDAFGGCYTACMKRCVDDCRRNPTAYMPWRPGAAPPSTASSASRSADLPISTWSRPHHRILYVFLSKGLRARDGLAGVWNRNRSNSMEG